jgi:hypothetical protein
VEKIQVSLESDKNNDYFKCTSMYICVFRSILFRMRKFKIKLYMKSKHKFCVPEVFPENRAFSEVMWKNVAELSRTQITK